MQILALLFFLAGQPGQSPAPDLLRSTNLNRHAPLWVSATAAAADGGELAAGHFESYELRMLQKAREQNRPRVSSNGVSYPQSCFGESPIEIAAPSGSLKALANAASTIIEGEVTGRTNGFFQGTPGSLLSVRVHRKGVTENTFSVPDDVLVYYPEADFNVGKSVYCIRPASHPARPRGGDRILIFAYGPPVDTTGRLLYVQASKHLIFETADGLLLPPAALREELARLGLRNITDIVTWLEKNGLRAMPRTRTVAQ